MAPVLSLTKERLDAIKGATYFSVVSVRQEPSVRQKPSVFRVGFVWQHFGDKCVVITVKEGLEWYKKVFVGFQNGHTVEGSIRSSGQSRDSKLVAIVVQNLPFAPNPIKWCEDRAKQCDSVVHYGFFGNDCTMLGMSSGSVGLTGHNAPIRGNERFTMFVHCCSQMQCAIGAPVFNLRGEGVGINIFKVKDKNLFFAMDRNQIERETARLFGADGKGLVHPLGMGQAQARAAMERDRVKKRRTA